MLLVLTLVFISGVHLFALIYALMSVLHKSFYKLRPKTKNYFSWIKVGLNSEPQLHQDFSLLGLKSRMLVSVPVTIMSKD